MFFDILTDYHYAAFLVAITAHHTVTYEVSKQTLLRPRWKGGSSRAEQP